MEMRTSDGAAASILIDKRLAYAEDLDHYIGKAKATGRKLNMYDVDAALEVSLAGVLERQPAGPDPLPPFYVVAEGFSAVRGERLAIIDKFLAEPELGTYELYGTRPDGAKLRVASVIDGKLRVFDEAMYEDITAPPADAPEVFGARVITAAAIDEITAALAPDRAAQVRAALAPYVGYTWRAALDSHARAK
jgi:hypothetical protein